MIAGKSGTHLASVVPRSMGRASRRSLPCESVQGSEDTSRHHRQERRTLIWVPPQRTPRTTCFSSSSPSALWSGSAPDKVLGPLQAHHLRNKQLTYCLGRPRRSGDDLSAGTRPEKHGGRVSTAASSRARCLETPAGSAFESPGHRTWSGGHRTWSGGATRGSVVCLSHYIVDLLVQERSDYISNR